MPVLNDTTIRAAAPGEKPYKLFDRGGLHLLISGTSKRWRVRYIVGGKEKILTLGEYPAISPAKARQKRDSIHEAITEGRDPSEDSNKLKADNSGKAEDTFGKTA